MVRLTIILNQRRAPLMGNYQGLLGKAARSAYFIAMTAWMSMLVGLSWVAFVQRMFLRPTALLRMIPTWREQSFVPIRLTTAVQIRLMQSVVHWMDQRILLGWIPLGWRFVWRMLPSPMMIVIRLIRLRVLAKVRVHTRRLGVRLVMILWLYAKPIVRRQISLIIIVLRLLSLVRSPFLARIMLVM